MELKNNQGVLSKNDPSQMTHLTQDIFWPPAACNKENISGK